MALIDWLVDRYVGERVKYKNTFLIIGLITFIVLFVLLQSVFKYKPLIVGGAIPFLSFFLYLERIRGLRYQISRLGYLCTYVFSPLGAVLIWRAQIGVLSPNDTVLSVLYSILPLLGGTNNVTSTESLGLTFLVVIMSYFYFSHKITLYYWEVIDQIILEMYGQNS